MEYLADTVAIIRHFAKSGKIGKTAKQILRGADKGEETILISVVTRPRLSVPHDGQGIFGPT